MIEPSNTLILWDKNSDMVGQEPGTLLQNSWWKYGYSPSHMVLKGFDPSPYIFLSYPPDGESEV